MHYFYACLCLLAGAAIAWIGYRLKAPYERPRDATGFAGPILSRHLLIGGAADLMVVVGLIIAVIFTLIFALT